MQFQVSKSNCINLIPIAFFSQPLNHHTSYKSPPNQSWYSDQNRNTQFQKLRGIFSVERGGRNQSTCKLRTTVCSTGVWHKATLVLLLQPLRHLSWDGKRCSTLKRARFMQSRRNVYSARKSNKRHQHR